MREDAKFHVWLLSGYCSGYSVAIVGLNHKEGHVHLHTLFCTRVTVATVTPAQFCVMKHMELPPPP